MVHMAAYRDNTLGNPLLCPLERLRSINSSTIHEYRNTFYKPNRMVVAFAGVSHESALELTEKYFGDMQPDPSSPLATRVLHDNSPEASSQPQSSSYPQEASRLITKIPFYQNFSTSAPHQADVVEDIRPHRLDPLTQVSHYTGGFIARDPLSPPKNPALPALTHIHLALEALPIGSTDIFALATLQTLLGGGGSFSAGGPGKGMYSRLYTNVLNQHSWVESCIAFNHSYTDSGLFGISASCSPSYVRQCIEVMCRELHALTLDSGYAALQEGEVRRAKNQLRSSLLMNLESRMIELEDLGRQIQVHGREISVQEMCSKIEALTVQDLRRVAKLVVHGLVENPGQGSGAPTVVLQEGEEEGTTLRQLEWGEIQERMRRRRIGRM